MLEYSEAFETEEELLRAQMALYVSPIPSERARAAAAAAPAVQQALPCPCSGSCAACRGSTGAPHACRSLTSGLQAPSLSR